MKRIPGKEGAAGGGGGAEAKKALKVRKVTERARWRVTRWLAS